MGGVILKVFIIEHYQKPPKKTQPKSFFELEAVRVDGATVNFKYIRGARAYMIWIVGCDCLLTKSNMQGFRKLQQKYRGKVGFLAFLSNFTNQQNRTTQQSMALIKNKYKADKLMWFKQVNPNGPDAHPVFVYLRMNTPQLNQHLNSESGEIKTVPWVHTKFVLDSQGRFVSMIKPQRAPEDAIPDLQRLII